MKDAADAYAAWRLANPATVGWPQEAFMAGWEACADVFAEPPTPAAAGAMAMWWLNFEFPRGRFDEVVSVVRIRDFWIMTTTRAIWKFSADHDGSPRVQLVQELS